MKARERLFVVPEEEKNPHDIKVTLNYMKFAPILGIIVAVTLSIVWAIPYLLTK